VAENEHQSAERQSFLELTRSITSLPLDQTAAVLETSAAIAGISLRTGIEFLRAAPAAAQVLQPAELRAWGEIDKERDGGFIISHLVLCRGCRAASQHFT
jgi:hypothetical protein